MPVASGERVQAEGRLDQREAGAVLERALVHDPARQQREVAYHQARDPEAELPVVREELAVAVSLSGVVSWVLTPSVVLIGVSALILVP